MSRDPKEARTISFSKFLPPGMDAVIIDLPVFDGTLEMRPTLIMRAGFGVDEAKPAIPKDEVT